MLRLYTNTSNQTGQCSVVILQAIWKPLVSALAQWVQSMYSNGYNYKKNYIVCLYAVYNIYGSFLRELQEKFLEKCSWLD